MTLSIEPQQRILLCLVIAFVTFGVACFCVFWIGVVRRELFDPGIYVLYGMIHWLLISQIGTLLGFNFYEVKPHFPEELHIIGSVSISSAVLICAEDA